MRTIFLLCAAFSLSVAAVIVPAEEVAAAPEKHLDEERPVRMLTEEMLGDVRLSSCQLGWSTYGSRCFLYIHREMPWVDAENYCNINGANLASIHDRGEYQFIQEIVRGSTGRFPEAWIGGNDAVQDYAWLWSDGSGFHFKDWAVTEPNNHQGREKCIVMNRPGELRWGDANCEMQRPFICGTRPL